MWNNLPDDASDDATLAPSLNESTEKSKINTKFTRKNLHDLEGERKGLSSNPVDQQSFDGIISVLQQMHVENMWLNSKFDHLSHVCEELFDALERSEEKVNEISEGAEMVCRRKNKEYSKLKELHNSLVINIQRTEEEHCKLLQSHEYLKTRYQGMEDTQQELVKRTEDLQTELTSKKDELLFLQKKVTQLENSWKISHNEVKLLRTELGRGGWGVVLLGQFRGQKVAVKQIHELIKSDEYLELLHREINTMSQLRHPNLLQFIGAVLDHPSGNPMIITEVMDTSLRKAYESKELTPDPSCRPVILSIMRDVAVGLNYLHCLPVPIIHRDVSSANVLLESKGHKKWKTKLSDFGSANLVPQAVTKAPGAVVYSAPEAHQTVSTLHRKSKRQTTKMDSFSYGVLLCEMTICKFPSVETFPDLIHQVKIISSRSYDLIVSCINNDEPDQRPSIKQIIMMLDHF